MGSKSSIAPHPTSLSVIAMDLSAMAILSAAAVAAAAAAASGAKSLAVFLDVIFGREVCS